MIPPFTEAGFLPPGIYWATWEEIVDRYGKNIYRSNLLLGLRAALLSLQNAGCATVYLDGSFVAATDKPGDFDACWELEGVFLELLDPVLLDFSAKQHVQKLKYKGELFPILPPNLDEPTILEIFQRVKLTHEKKGIIAIDLRTFE